MGSEEADKKACKYSRAIGRGLPTELLAEITEFSSDATRREWFADRQLVPFWFERFDKNGLTEKLSILADVWVEVSGMCDCRKHAD